MLSGVTGVSSSYVLYRQLYWYSLCWQSGPKCHSNREQSISVLRLNKSKHLYCQLLGYCLEVQVLSPDYQIYENNMFQICLKLVVPQQIVGNVENSWDVGVGGQKLQVACSGLLESFTYIMIDEVIRSLQSARVIQCSVVSDVT